MGGLVFSVGDRGCLGRCRFCRCRLIGFPEPFFFIGAVCQEFVENCAQQDDVHADIQPEH